MVSCALTAAGRVTNVHTIGSKLIFIKLKDGEDEIQALVNRANVIWDEKPVRDERWDLFRQTVRKGDYYSTVALSRSTSVPN